MSSQNNVTLLMSGILMAQNITEEMLKDYLDHTHNEEDSGIPDDYFYAFMETKLKSARETTYNLLNDVKNKKYERVGSEC